MVTLLIVWLSLLTVATFILFISRFPACRRKENAKVPSKTSLPHKIVGPKHDSSRYVQTDPENGDAREKCVSSGQSPKSSCKESKRTESSKRARELLRFVQDPKSDDQISELDTVSKRDEKKSLRKDPSLYLRTDRFATSSDQNDCSMKSRTTVDQPEISECERRELDPIGQLVQDIVSEVTATPESANREVGESAEDDLGETESEERSISQRTLSWRSKAQNRKEIEKLESDEDEKFRLGEWSERSVRSKSSSETLNMEPVVQDDDLKIGQSSSAPHLANESETSDDTQSSSTGTEQSVGFRKVSSHSKLSASGKVGKGSKRKRKKSEIQRTPGEAQITLSDGGKPLAISTGVDCVPGEVKSKPQGQNILKPKPVRPVKVPKSAAVPKPEETKEAAETSGLNRNDNASQIYPGNSAEQKNDKAEISSSGGTSEGSTDSDRTKSSEKEHSEASKPKDLTASPSEPDGQDPDASVKTAKSETFEVKTVSPKLPVVKNTKLGETRPLKLPWNDHTDWRKVATAVTSKQVAHPKSAGVSWPPKLAVPQINLPKSENLIQKHAQGPKEALGRDLKNDATKIARSSSNSTLPNQASSKSPANHPSATVPVKPVHKLLGVPADPRTATGAKDKSPVSKISEASQKSVSKKSSTEQTSAAHSQLLPKGTTGSFAEKVAQQAKLPRQGDPVARPKVAVSTPLAGIHSGQTNPVEPQSSESTSQAATQDDKTSSPKDASSKTALDAISKIPHRAAPVVQLSSAKSAVPTTLHAPKVPLWKPASPGRYVKADHAETSVKSGKKVLQSLEGFQSALASSSNPGASQESRSSSKEQEIGK